MFVLGNSFLSFPSTHHLPTSLHSANPFLYCSTSVIPFYLHKLLQNIKQRWITWETTIDSALMV
jgi:hypothetical protein